MLYSLTDILDLKRQLLFVLSDIECFKFKFCGNEKFEKRK